MNNFVDAQGNTIPDEQLQEAAASGNLHALPGTKVHMRDATGRPVLVDAENAGQALGSGFFPELSSDVSARQQSKEFGTVGQKVAAGAEGAARGLTFGLSDLAISGLSEEWRQNAQARQTENPYSAGAGEVVGALAPLIASGGSSAAAQAASAPMRGAQAVSRALIPSVATETALGRMALRAGQAGMTGAIEGALYGAGTTAGGLALRGDQITAEKVASGGARGALIAGILGAAGGAVASRSERAPLAAGDDAALAAKARRLDEATAKAARAEERLASKLETQSARTEAKSSLLDRVAAEQAIASIKPGARTLTRHAKNPAAIDELISEAGQDYLSYEMRTGPLAGKRIFHAASKPSDALDDIAHAFSETDDLLRQFKTQAAETIRNSPELAPDMGDLISKINAKAPDVDPSLLVPLRDAYRTQRAGIISEELSALEYTRNSLRETLETTTKPSAQRELRTAYHAVDDVLNETTEGALNRAGVDTSLFRQEQRMHRSLSFVKDAVEELKLAKYSSRGGIEDNAAGYALVAALSGNFAGAIAAGATMYGQQFLKQRASGVIAELAHRVARSDFRLGMGAKALAGDGFKYPVAKSLTRPLNGPLAERFFAKVAETAKDPERRARYVAEQTEPYATQYPELAASVGMTLGGDLDYLASKIPARTSRFGATLTPAATSSKPVGSKGSAEAFWESVHALEDPGYVVDEVLSGRVPRAAIEALKARRPAEWNRLRTLVIQETAVLKDELPFKRRITLGTAFDFAADKSLQPGRMEAIQTSLVPVQGPGAPQTTGAIKANEGAADSLNLPSDEV